MSTPTKSLRVPLGQILATPGVLKVTTLAERSIAVHRHARGDWGDVTEADWHSNDWAFQGGDRLLSVYHTLNGTKFWIITEADRSATTILLPQEY